MSSIVLAQQASQPATPAAGKLRLYVTNDAIPRFFAVNPDGSLTPISPANLSNFSPSTVSAGYAADTYVAGCSIAMPKALARAGSLYYGCFDMVKTGAGLATPIVNVRFGTAGSTGDTARLTFTFTAGSAAADTGLFEVWAHFRNVGASAVLAGVCRLTHSLAATGLTTGGTGGSMQSAVVSGSFDATVASSILGLSFNGGASFSGTNTMARAEMANI